MKKIPVHLKERSYSILIGQNLLARTGEWLKPLHLGKKILIVSNRKVSALLSQPLIRSLREAGFEVPQPFHFHYGNEKDKTVKSLQTLWMEMARQKLDRTSSLLALGGGTVGDIAGFAAATYMRGISVIQVPTTLLAQVDAAIGGKTAVDLPAAKNIVGAFHQPRLVIADVATLGKMGLTRPGLRELRNSFAEVIKYGMIQDKALFALLEKKMSLFFRNAAKKKLEKSELLFLEEIVKRSAAVKARVVEKDEYETKGVRMILNYGHTFGHAFETASKYQIPHGEAVAVGMVCAARAAVLMGFLETSKENRQNRLIEAAGFPLSFKGRRLRYTEILKAMLLDKKKNGKKIRFILPVAIGQAKVMDFLPAGVIEKVIKEVV